MKLNQAYLCGNCEEVHASATRCPSCGSVAIVHLGNLLNKTRVAYVDAQVSQVMRTVDRVNLR